MTSSPAQQFLINYRKKTDPLFEKFLQKKINEASSIGEAPFELVKKFSNLGRRGKRVRGALVVIGYKVSGGKEEENIYDASLFIELFQAGLLIHDDIMDQDDLRRGIPTIHKQFGDLAKMRKIITSATQYGESMAIDAGDLALFLAFEKLLNSNFPSHRLIKAGKIFTKSAVRVAYGQALDISANSYQSTREAEILNVLKLKTAEYSGILPLLIGAALAGLKEKKRLQALEKYGLCLGWAFQIRDDLLGMFSQEGDIGKPVGSDLREGKNTLLTLHLLRKGTKEQRKLQKKLLGNKNISKKDVEKMKKVLKKAGSFDYVLNLGWKYVKQGRKEIPKITQDEKLQKLLQSFLDYTIKRSV